MKKLLYLLLLVCASVTAQIKVAVPFVKNNPADNSITGYADLLNGGLHAGLTYHSRDSLSTYFSTTLKQGMYFHVYNRGVVDSMYQWSGLGWLPVIYGTDILPLNNIFTGTNTFNSTIFTSDIRSVVTTPIDTYWPTNSQVFFSRSINTQSVLQSGNGSAANILIDASQSVNGRTLGWVNRGGQMRLYSYLDNGSFKNLISSIDTSGALTANSFIKSGGSGSQILAANGGVITAGTNISISGGVISATTGGTVASVSSANSDISVTGTTNPVLTLNSGTGANQIVKRDGSGHIGVGIADLTATGTPSSTTYLRGDNTWATVVGGVSSFNSRTGAVTPQAGDYSAITETLTNKTISGTSNTLSNIALSTSVTGLLPIANGGTGTSTPGIIAGSSISVTGTWPNQTINADTTTIGSNVVHKAINETITGQKTFTKPIVLSGNSSPSYLQGGLYYDTSNESLTFFNNDNNVSLQIGQEEWIRVINNTGSTIANGAAVYINGSSGGLPTVALAQANSGATAVGAGLATESIANGATGYITSLGVVNGLNTSSFSIGAIYISETTAGALTQTAPVSPNYRYRIGFVTSVNTTTGKIHVTPATASIGNGTANQLFGMNTAGTAQELKTIQGTTNQIIVTPGTNLLTLSVDTTSSTGLVSKTRLSGYTYSKAASDANYIKNNITNTPESKSFRISGTGYTAGDTIKAAIPVLTMITSADGNKSVLSRNATANTLTLINSSNSVGGLGSAMVQSTNNSFATGADTGLPTGSSMVITYSITFKTTSSSTAYFSGYGNENSSTGIAFRFNTPTNMLLYVGGQQASFTLTSALNDGNNHNLIFTLNGNTALLYVDGTVYTSTTIPTYTAVALNGVFKTISQQFSNTALIGTIGQILIYNRVLSTTSGSGGANEIAQIVAGGAGTQSVPQSGLIRCYLFTETSGTTVGDTNPVGTHYNLTFSGSPVPTWAGTGNGLIPTSGSLSSITALTFSDGVNDGETMTSSIGAALGGTWMNGKNIGFSINSKFPLVANTNGILISNVNTDQTPNITAQLQLGPGTTAANTSALKMTTGALPTTGEAGIFGAYVAPDFFVYPSTTAKKLAYYTNATASTGQTLVGDGAGGFTLATFVSTLRLTGSGNGSSTTISIAHGLTGITSSSIVNVMPINSASSGISYVTADATNINIVYVTAPVTGTNNLSYNVTIKP